MPDRPARRGVAAPPSGLGDWRITPRRLAWVTLLAVPVGVAASLLATLLARMIGLFTNLFFYGRLSTHLVSFAAVDRGPRLVIVPVLGAVVVGLLARFGSDRIRGHGMPETISAILTRGSRVQPRLVVLKPLASAIAIGSGGPFGAEGPIIASGGAVGSVIAQYFKLTADERKTLLVAGAAGGMAAIFNAPVAAILLAVELLLFEYRPRSLVPVSTAVVVATLGRYLLLGEGPLFPGDAPLHPGPGIFAGCLLVGLVVGAVAIACTLAVGRSERMFERLPFHWMWWPAVGGLVIGIGGLIQPRALGVGYDSIQALVSSQMGVRLALSVLIVKAVIWSVALGSGTSGGVVAPLVLIGAATGVGLSPVLPGDTGLWALVGVAAVLGGALQVPLTGVMFALEVTHRWDALLPLTLASFTAWALSVVVLKRSILTEKIAHRGLHVSRDYSVDPLETLLVREVMTSKVTTFAWDSDTAEVVEAFVRERRTTSQTHKQRLYPVIDADRNLRGIVTRRDIVDLALDGRRPAGQEGAEAPPRFVDLIGTDPVIIHPDMTLRAAAWVMAEYEVTRLPVVTRESPGRLVGLLTLPQLLDGRLRQANSARQESRVLRLRVRTWRSARPYPDGRPAAAPDASPVPVAAGLSPLDELSAAAQSPAAPSSAAPTGPRPAKDRRRPTRHRLDDDVAPEDRISREDLAATDHLPSEQPADDRRR